MWAHWVFGLGVSLVGLLSHYVAYRFGKRRGQKKNEKPRGCDFVPMNGMCLNYDYCTERGSCINEGQCIYE